jgi:phage terminase large subunit-like protein
MIKKLNSTVKKSASRGKSIALETRAERNIRWIEKHCRVPEGRFVGQPLIVAPYMRDDFKAIYDNPHGTRRAIISRGRKNAKTTESAMILLLHTCGPEAKPNSQLNSAAQSRDQAAILFSLAAKMIRLSPTLNAFCIIRDTAKQIACPELGTLYKALSADASTAYGLSPALTVHDELGQVKGPKSELYEALETATAAQDAPLSIVISTQAPSDADLLSILIEDAKTGADPKTVLRLDTAPIELDMFSEAAIRAANPAFDLFMNKEEVLAMAQNAKRMPSRQPEFENLVLNRRVETNSPFVSKTVWDENSGEVAKSFEGFEIFAGLDLSETSDLTALVRTAFIDGAWHVNPTFWLPKEGLKEKSRTDRVPYDVWAEIGALETTPGKSIQYEWVAARMFDMHQSAPFKKIAFDRWNFKHLMPWLQRAGFRDDEIEGDTAIFVEFGQGFQSMSPALRTLEGDLLETKIKHGAHPVLTMCAANATTQMDPSGNRKLSKSKSHGRIDGMVALAMARGVGGSHMAMVAPISPWENPDYKMAAA